MTQVLAVAHFCKGERILETFRDLGCQITLLSRVEMQEAEWPRHLLREVFFVKDFRDRRDVLNAVSYLHQDRDFQIVAPLDEYAVGTCATLRAHLGCPGLCEGTTRKVRDKLIMRCVAQEHGLPVPRYCGFNNKTQIRTLLESSDGPWMLKPRAAGGSVRIQKLRNPSRVWEVYEEMQDQRSHHILEEFVAGQVYHVDSVMYQGELLLEVPGRYLSSPFEVWNSGGVFAARTVPRRSKLAKELLKLNRRVIKAMGLRNGVSHAEFVGVPGAVNFLEVAARVPGSNLDQLATASTGVDLFQESAKIQYSRVSGEAYSLANFFYQEASLVQCLCKEKAPDLGELLGVPQVCWKLEGKDYHAGLAFRSKRSAEIESLTEHCLERFRQDFLGVLPASDSPA